MNTTQRNPGTLNAAAREARLGEIYALLPRRSALIDAFAGSDGRDVGPGGIRRSNGS